MSSLTAAKLSSLMLPDFIPKMKKYRQVIDAIETVHQHPQGTALAMKGLPNVSLQKKNSEAKGRFLQVKEIPLEKKLLGDLSLPADTVLLAYQVNPSGNATSATPTFTLLHEFGHFLDYAVARARGLDVTFASEDPAEPFHLIYVAAQNSQLTVDRREALKTFDQDVDNPPADKTRAREGVEGTTTPPELFACAYAQYITLRSLELPKGRDELIQLRQKGSEMYWFVDRRYWRDDDFEPIAAALEAALKSYGLSKSR